MAILESLSNMFMGEANLFFILTFFTAVIVIYSIFVFNFYRFLAKKNILELNLNQYNRSEHQTIAKILAVIFYIIEYIIILPILTFFWFAVLASLILILAKGIETNIILLISAALIASVRVTAYVTEDLSKDLAKMLPFTLLAIAFTTAGFFDVSALMSRISEIPALLSHIPYYLIFIIAIELIMRVAEFIQNTTRTLKATEEPTPTE